MTLLSEPSGRLPFRVILADDHTLLRQALKLLLEAHPEVTVVGEAADGYEAVSLADQLHPDVVLMDINMPRLNGIEATRQIVKRHPGVRVIIVSAYSERRQLVDSVRAGAIGYLVKRSDIDEVILAVRMVYSGNPYFSAELAGSMNVAELLYDARSEAGRTAADSLTPREREVVQLLAEGFTCRASAERLVLSEKTVEGHCARAMAKLGTRTRADLVRVAIRDGIVGFREVDPPEPLRFPTEDRTG